MQVVGKIRERYGWLSGFLVLGPAIAWMGSALIGRPAIALGREPGRASLSASSGPSEIWQKQDYRAIAHVFDSAQSDFDPELLKAIAWVESRWRHLSADRLIFVTDNYKKAKTGRGGAYITQDWGLMQINDRMESLNSQDWSLERIRTDPECNLRAAIAVLASKRTYIKQLRRRSDWKALQARYRLQGHTETEILLKAYNGFQPSWAYVNKVKAAWATKPWEQAILRQWREQALRPGAKLGESVDPRTFGVFGPELSATGKTPSPRGSYFELFLPEPDLTLTAVSSDARPPAASPLNRAPESGR